MDVPVSLSEPSLQKDYFISRAGADKALAMWIGRLIAAQGKSYILQDDHFGHQDFMGAMDAALKSGARVVALYSQAYLDSENCLKEALTAVHGDSFNRQQRLIPLRIEPCAPDGMLRTIAYTDLLAERRQADDSALKLKILRALGFANPVLDGLPAPVGALVARPRHIHREIEIKRSDLAPRPDLMARLKASMSGAGRRIAALTNSQYVVSAIAGMAGVGKTVLARTYAWEQQDSYHGVWWVDAETRGGILAGLAGLGAELSAAIKAETNIERAARETLKLIEDRGSPRPFLLVYDNVERPADIERWMPRAGAHMLLTTRWPDWDPIVGNVDVGVLDREVAIDFLCHRAGRPDDREDAGLLADELGCLPLALDHAASYCRAPPRPRFKAYREKLLAQRLNNKPTEGSRLGEYPRSVRETFAIALDRVISGEESGRHKARPEAETIMGVASLLAPVPIPYSTFRHPRLASADIDGAFRALAEVSLIATGEDEHGEGTFTVHRLVQAVMRDRLAEASHASEVTALAVELVTSAYPQRSEDFSNWPTCKALTAHALAILPAVPDTAETAPRASLLAFNVAKYLQAVARYSEAEPLLKRSLAIKEKTVGGEHPDTSATLHELARLHLAQGCYSEAEPLFKRSLAIYEKTLGGEHPYTSISLRQTARLALDLGRLDEAEAAITRARTIQQRAWESDHPRHAETGDVLALVALAKGRLAESETVAREALSLRQQKLPADHPEIAQSRWTLARVLIAQGRAAEAEPLLRAAIAALEARVTPEHVWLKGARATMASLTEG